VVQGDIIESTRAERVNGRDDHRCFGCGRLNPHRLRLAFYRNPDEERIWASFTPATEHEGFAGVTHRGIVTAVLDEAIGWVIFDRGIWAVTGKLSVTFRRPVETGVATRVRAWVISDRGRAFQAAGEVRREDDEALLAEGTATFIRVPEEQARIWQARYVGGTSDG
jgi:acyl-coenzyme A thioesterase PaaI-like protein